MKTNARCATPFPQARISLRSRPFSPPPSAVPSSVEGFVDFDAAMDRAERFGHGLSHTVAGSEASGVVQRKLNRDDALKLYQHWMDFDRSVVPFETMNAIHKEIVRGSDSLSDAIKRFDEQFAKYAGDVPAPSPGASGSGAVPRPGPPSSSSAALGEQDGGEEAEEESFGSRKAAYAYLARKLNFDPDQLSEIISFAPHRFEGFEHFTPSVIDDYLPDLRRQVEGIERQMESMPEVGSGRSSGGDWATSAVRKSAVGLAAEGSRAVFPGGKYTIHHKVSRSKLRSLHGRMEEEGHGAEPLRSFLRNEMAPVVTGGGGGGGTAPSTLKALLSMPGNLEVGPPTDERAKDPGSDFDPNLDSGAMTPRSAMLNAVDSIDPRGKIDWTELAKRLRAVQGAHARVARGNLLSAPLEKQWKKGKGNKFERG